MPKGQASEAQIRLIRVDSGEVLAAISEKLDKKFENKTVNRTPPRGDSRSSADKRKWGYQKVFSFTSEKELKESWAFDPKAEYQVKSNGTIFGSGKSGTGASGYVNVQFKGRLTGDFDVGVKMHGMDTSEAIVAGERIVITTGAYEGTDAVLQVSRRGDLLRILMNDGQGTGDKSSSIQIKQDNLDKPAGLSVSLKGQISEVGIRADKCEFEKE